MGIRNVGQRSLVVGFVVALSGVGSGCGSDSDSSGGKGPGASGGTCESVISAYSEYSVQCFGLGISESEKQAALRRCGDQLSAPGTTMSGANLSSCYAALRSGNCRYTSAIAQACGSSPGTLGVGSPCLYDTQCASLGCVLPAAGGSCGTCAALLTAGSPCSVGEVCEYGTSCHNSVCTPVVWLPAGSACDAADFTQRCDAGTVCRDGTCKLPAGIGEACANDYSTCEWELMCEDGVCASEPGEGQPCPDYLCAAGLSCDNERICRTVILAGPGEVCGRVISAYCESGLCSAMSVSETGTCPAVLSEGTPCDESLTPGAAACDQSLECVAGTCTFVTAASCK